MADKPVTREEKYLAYLTGDYTGEIPKPITRKEKYLYELCLKGIGGEISPEEIKAAVNEYLEKNPVKPGATTEQAQQIEQNKTDVASLKEETSSLKEDLVELGNKTLHEEYADLLHGKEPKENWYIDASNGTGRTLAQFFSYIDIDVSEYIGKKLYPYTSHKGTNVHHSSRSVVFYDESGAFISGTGVSSNNPINGIEVPKKSKTASICFNYESDNNQPIKPQVYYLAINRENKNKLMLKKRCFDRL